MTKREKKRVKKIIKKRGLANIYKLVLEEEPAGAMAEFFKAIVRDMLDSSSEEKLFAPQKGEDIMSQYNDLSFINLYWDGKYMLLRTNS